MEGNDEFGQNRSRKDKGEGRQLREGLIKKVIIELWLEK